MLDGGSDVIDWLVAFPWEALGIGAAIILAPISFIAFSWTVLRAAAKRRKRRSIGDFVFEGQELVRRCGEEPPPQDETDDWAQRVEAYLEKDLGSDYVASFRSDAGLPPFTPAFRKGPSRRLEMEIKISLARLEEFLDEQRR